MIVKNPYFKHNAVFNDDELSSIIALGESLPSTRATVFEGTKNGHRDSHVSWITMTDDSRWLYRKLISVVTQINQFAEWNFEHSILEKLQYTRYDENQHYNWHADQHSQPYPSSDKHLAGLTRKISFTVMLNDDYEGGNFELEYGLPESENRVKVISPKKGLTIFFPSFMMHRVTPVTSGRRRSLVGWVCGKPYR